MFFCIGADLGWYIYPCWSEVYYSTDYTFLGFPLLVFSLQNFCSFIWYDFYLASSKKDVFTINYSLNFLLTFDLNYTTVSTLLNNPFYDNSMFISLKYFYWTITSYFIMPIQYLLVLCLHAVFYFKNSTCSIFRWSLIFCHIIYSSPPLLATLISQWFYLVAFCDLLYSFYTVNP